MTEAPATASCSSDHEHHPVQVLGLGDRRAHDVAQRHRLAPGPRRLLARQHEQALGVAPDPGGEVVEGEQLGERVRVALRVLELVDDLQLAVEHALVAPGQVDQHVRGELARPISASASWRASSLLGSCSSSVTCQNSITPMQASEHRDAVDERPQPRVGLRRGVVEDQVRSHIEPTPWLTMVNRTFRTGTAPSPGRAR